MDHNARNGLLFVLLSSLAYASFPIFTKFIYRHSALTELDLAFWRFAMAVPLMWLATSLWMRASKPPRLEKPLPRVALMVSGLFVVGAAFTGFYGLRIVDAGLYVVLFFTYPTMTVIINTFLGEPLPLKGWVALALTTLGAMLMVVNPLQWLNGEATDMLVTPLGVTVALTNALLIALFMITNERVQRGYPTTARASAWTFTGTLFVMLPFGAVQGVQAPPTATVWLLLLGMSLFGTVVSYFGLMMGNKLLGPSRTAIVGTLEPVLAVLLAIVLLGERLQPTQLLGSVLVVSSIVVLEARFARRKSSKVKQAAA